MLTKCCDHAKHNAKESTDNRIWNHNKNRSKFTDDSLNNHYKCGPLNNTSTSNLRFNKKTELIVLKQYLYNVNCTHWRIGKRNTIWYSRRVQAINGITDTTFYILPLLPQSLQHFRRMYLFRCPIQKCRPILFQGLPYRFLDWLHAMEAVEHYTFGPRSDNS